MCLSVRDAVGRMCAEYEIGPEACLRKLLKPSSLLMGLKDRRRNTLESERKDE